MKKNFHIIGAGHVGKTLAALLTQHPQWQLSHIVSHSMPSESPVAVVRHVADLPQADVILICTPDNIIEATAQEIARLPWLNPKTVVIHFSGAKTIGVLAAAAQSGAATASLHPVFAFADVEAAVQNLSGNICALETDNPHARSVLQDLAQALGLQAFEMPSEHKARYHAALSAASNFSVALAAYAQNLLNPLNLPETLSRQLVCNLMQQSVNNLNRLPPLQALTGPIVRGDDSTVAAHLACMSADERQIYRDWARVTLALAAGRLSSDGMERIAAVLSERDE